MLCNNCNVTCAISQTKRTGEIILEKKEPDDFSPGSYCSLVTDYCLLLPKFLFQYIYQRRLTDLLQFVAYALVRLIDFYHLTDTSLTVPVDAGNLSLGTWQGIYIFEHRSRPHRRKVLMRVLSVD